MNRLPEDEFKDVIAALRQSAPEPPPVHWGAYRAELRDKLLRRTQAWTGWGWRLRPAQLAVAAAFIAVLVYIGLPGHGSMPSDPLLIENPVLASRLDMIANLDVIQKLDVLEDFDVIQHLDSLHPRGEG